MTIGFDDFIPVQLLDTNQESKVNHLWSVDEHVA